MTDHATAPTGEDMSSLPPLVVGETRIRDVDGFVGTVAHVGPVASAKNASEVYVGVVWDDASRGKHDGSVLCRQTNQVVRHFGGHRAILKCGPTQGSFLRLNKVDRGVTLTAPLLQEKYVGMRAPVIAPNNLLPHTARTSSGRDKAIEFLGELQIRGRQQLVDIHKVSLRRAGISRAGAPSIESGNSTDELSGNEEKYWSNIRDVDLAGNLLCNWEEVLKMVSQFSNLTDLSLAYNRIQDISLPLSASVSLDRLQVLNLNHCGIQSFATVKWVADAMPDLRSLCIASSKFSDMGSFEDTCLDGQFLELQILDCSHCGLTSWEGQVERLMGRLQGLHQLSLDDNPLSCIPKRNVGDQKSFASLLALQLAGTLISSWTDLEGLNDLPQLRSLRLKNTPLTSTLGQGEVRFLAVARFPTLGYLNGSIISTQERIEGERRYVTFVAHLLAKVEALAPPTENQEHGKADSIAERQNILVEHPQYSRLREVHKSLIISGGGGAGQGANGVHSVLALSVCNVTITSMAASSCDMEPLLRRLPGTLTVGRLKALCARAFGLDVGLMTLHFRTKSDAFPIELDSDDKTLSYYGVCDGAEILMNEIDLQAQRREAQRLAQEQDERMLQQERDATAMQELKRQNNKAT